MMVRNVSCGAIGFWEWGNAGVKDMDCRGNFVVVIGMSCVRMSEWLSKAEELVCEVAGAVQV